MGDRRCHRRHWLALAGIAVSMSAGSASAQEGLPVPTAYAEQNAAAWVLWNILCDAGQPGLPPPDGIAAVYCSILRSFSLDYLGALLAMESLPTTMRPTIPFPEISEPLLARLWQDIPAAAPAWEVRPTTTFYARDAAEQAAEALRDTYAARLIDVLTHSPERVEALGLTVR
ncbi:MAG: hypothetical protein KIS68_03435 [Bauldia sp.]|nr:hypothetical protein [Bauldia sp.]